MGTRRTYWYALKYLRWKNNKIDSWGYHQDDGPNSDSCCTTSIIIIMTLILCATNLMYVHIAAGGIQTTIFTTDAFHFHIQNTKYDEQSSILCILYYWIYSLPFSPQLLQTRKEKKKNLACPLIMQLAGNIFNCLYGCCVHN